MQDMSLNLVYTMGKVASIAVSESLTCSGIPNHHVHLMTDDSLYEAMAESTRKRAFPADHVGRSISIYRRFKNSKRVKIVTLIRDPLARNISTVFQNLPKKSYGFQALSSLVKQLPTDPITQWNEEQFKLATGISLFDVGFSPEDKFSVYCSGRFEILTIRTDLSNTKKSKLLSDFFHQEVNVGVANEANTKWYNELYMEFLKEMPLNTEWIDHCLNSVGISVFFTDNEIANLRKQYSTV